MAAAIGEGIVMGLLLSALIGPVFFLLIETATGKGMKAAFFVDAGVVLSDLLWIIVLYFGAASLLMPVVESKYATLGAGLLFLVVGADTLVSRKQTLSTTQPATRYSGCFLRGFVLNTLNPSVALFWFGVTSVATLQFNGNVQLIFLFLASTILTSAALDALKIYTAHRLSNLLTTNGRRLIKLLTGTGFVVFAIVLIVKFAWPS